MTPDTTTTADLVLAARDGDTGAFDTLVSRHQRACLGYARGLLADEATARDAVQDALVDAWVQLHRLREPAAFVGWLRRIVFKHCDRRRRRWREVGAEEGTPHGASAPVDPDEARRWRVLRDAVEGLPEHERVVVAMHHLGGLPVARIASFLGVSPSAVKKRLFTARQRLEPQEIPMLPAPPSLPDHVALFLALRAGDHDTLERVLMRRPALAGAEESWSDADALAGGFPLAHPRTPLVLAASLGDARAVGRLLAAGADPNGACSCTAAETPVWAATRHGHPAVVRQLLEAGADASVRTASGFGLGELARWRRDPALVDLLANHGVPVPALAPPPPSAFRVHPDGRLTTGIGALDLWTPLRRGDLVRLHAAAETGLTVLLAELAHAVGEAGGTTVWSTWTPHPWHARELRGVLSRAGAEAAVRLLTPLDDDVPSPEAVLPKALAVLEALPTHRPRVHVVFEQEHHALDLHAMLARVVPEADLTIVVRAWEAVTRGEAPDAAWEEAVDVVWSTDPRLASRGLFPAVDPTASRARRDDAPRTREARALVAAWVEAQPDLAEHPDHVAAARLLDVLTQPFHAATPDTGWPGRSWAADETTRRVDAAVAGRLDGCAPTTLRYADDVGA